MNLNTFKTLKWSFLSIVYFSLSQNINALDASNSNIEFGQPTIICPQHITIESTQKFINLDLLGKAESTDENIVITKVDIKNLNNCGTGTINRIWTIQNKEGKSSSCTQIISVINSYPFDENDIIFPFDYTTNECKNSDMSPNILKYPYAKPTVNFDRNDRIKINHEDIYLPTDGPSCFKILRKWTVIDECQYQSDNSKKGIWEHTQVIKVIDFQAPVFSSCPKDLIFTNYSSETEVADIELSVSAKDCSPELNYTYEIDLYSDGTIDKTGLSNDASGNYPLGNHYIKFTASDGCGNMDSCSFYFQIKDDKKSNPVTFNNNENTVLNKK